MRKTSILFLTIIFSVNGFSQSPSWAWAESSGEIYDDFAFGVSTDAGGNVYITGTFYQYPITFGSIILTNAGGDDIFIAKYDGAGNVIWAKRAGGTDYDLANSISNDANGNVYVAGNFRSTSMTLGTNILINAGSSFTKDIFIAKYDSSGIILWAKRMGGASDDYGLSVSAASYGNIYLTGSFQSSTIAFDSTTLTNAGLYDIFIAKYDSTGNALWAKNDGGTDYDYAYGVAADAWGNAYVTGKFKSSSIIFDSTTVTNAGGFDIFIAKYNSFGNILWARSVGGAMDDCGRSVSTDAEGNLYVVGYFLSSSITFGSITLTNAGGNDIFIVKYDGNGNVLWAKSAGGTDYDYAQSVSTDGNGNVYVTGSFGSSSIMFGSTGLTNPNVGWDNIFIAKYDSTGTVLWAKSAGGTNYDDAYGISVDTLGNAYVAGSYVSPSITFGTSTLTNSGSNDIYIAKLNSTTITGVAISNHDTSINLFPNPASSELRIENAELKIKAIEVYNAVGEKIYSQVSNLQSPISIDVSQLLPGIYFITVTDNAGNKVTKKVVKM
jgi:hypothetical protein